MKKYFLAVLLILGCLILLVIPKETPDLSYEYYDEVEQMRIYYIKDSQVLGVLMPTESKNKYEKIEEAFAYLTSKSNSASYDSFLNLSTKLISYELKNEQIYLNVSTDIYRMDDEVINLALAQLLYTYQELGYDEVYLLVDNEIINQIGNCNLASGIKDNLYVNYEVVSKTMENKTIKIHYQYPNKEKIFINYLVDSDTDEIEFKIKQIIKFINEEYQTNFNYISYDLKVNKLVIMLDGNHSSYEKLKTMLSQNINFEIQLMEKA